MNKAIIKWVVVSILIVAILVGTYFIIDKNNSAMPEPEHERSPMYSH